MHDWQTQELCVSDIVVISGVRDAGKTVDMRKNGRACHGILLLHRGGVRFSPVDADAVPGHAGNILLLPKGSRYVLRYTEDGTAFTLINFELFSPQGQMCSFSAQICLLPQNAAQPRIQELLAMLLQCNDSGTALLRRKGCFYQLLGEIFDAGLPLSGTLPKPKFTGILPGVKLLQERYAENIPVTELAALCNMSVSAFRELFTKQYGLSPIQYRNRLRIQRARYLLSMGSYTVAEAAYAVGFSNLGYFCRHYKKLTGETPSQAFPHDF